MLPINNQTVSNDGNIFNSMPYVMFELKLKMFNIARSSMHSNINIGIPNTTINTKIDFFILLIELVDELKYSSNIKNVIERIKNKSGIVITIEYKEVKFEIEIKNEAIITI